MSARFVALVAGVGFFFLALITQGVLPFFEPSATHQPRDGRGPQRYRSAQMDGDLGHRLHAAGEARPACLSARGLLVLPFPVRAAGDRRDASLGTGERGGRICLRRAASVRHAAHRSGSDPSGAQIQRRVASGAFLESADADAGFDHGPYRVCSMRRRSR